MIEDTSAEPQLHAYRKHRTFNRLKLAQSLDGRVAAGDGNSRWISGVEAREDVQVLRRQVQAIVIGSGTYLADRSALTLRGDLPTPQRPPWRVLLDGRGRCEATGPLVDPALGPTLYVSATDARFAQWQRCNARTLLLPQGIDLHVLSETLYREFGVLKVLCEGGACLAAAYLDAGLVDVLSVYIGPRIIGRNGLDAFALELGPALPGAMGLQLEQVVRFGDSVRLDYTMGREGV